MFFYSRAVLLTALLCTLQTSCISSTQERDTHPQLQINPELDGYQSGSNGTISSINWVVTAALSVVSVTATTLATLFGVKLKQKTEQQQYFLEHQNEILKGQKVLRNLLEHLKEQEDELLKNNAFLTEIRNNPEYKEREEKYKEFNKISPDQPLDPEQQKENVEMFLDPSNPSGYKMATLKLQEQYRFNETKEEHAEHITSILWFLYQHATTQYNNIKDFSHAPTILIEDPRGLLFHYLKQTQGAAPTNTVHYAHFRLNAHGFTLPTKDLPAKSRHVVFGQLPVSYPQNSQDPGHTFIQITTSSQVPDTISDSISQQSKAAFHDLLLQIAPLVVEIQFARSANDFIQTWMDTFQIRGMFAFHALFGAITHFSPHVNETDRNAIRHVERVRTNILGIAMQYNRILGQHKKGNEATFSWPALQQLAK